MNGLSIAMETGDADEEYAREEERHWWEHRYQATQDFMKVAVPFVYGTKVQLCLDKEEICQFTNGEY